MIRLILIIFVAATAFAQSQLAVVANTRKGQLNGTCSATATTCQVTNSSCTKDGYRASCDTVFAAGNVLMIENEAVYVCGVVLGSVTTVLQFGVSACQNADGRGYSGTIAAVHQASIVASVAPVIGGISILSFGACRCRVVHC